MKLCKLDSYDYTVIPGVIRIKIDEINDPIMVDILSEINRADGNIYVEGQYYFYLDRYEVVKFRQGMYMDLEVGQL